MVSENIKIQKLGIDGESVKREVFRNIKNPFDAFNEFIWNSVDAGAKNIIIKVKRGEAIIRGGDRFEPWHLTVIEGIRKERSKTNRLLKFIGLFLFINIVLFIVYYYATKYIKKFKPSRKDLIFLGLNVITFLVILRFWEEF